jgi:predicted ATPase
LPAYICSAASQEARAQAEASLTLAHEHGFALWLGWGTSLQGWALIEHAAQSGAREQREGGLDQLREGLAALRATGAELWVPLFLGALAQAYMHGGQAEEGLRVIAEALALVEKNEERWNEAELYRIKGELTLQKFQVPGSKFQATDPRPLTADPQAEAEACFRKAIEIAQKQQAKSLELRATMSLVRLRQHQASEQSAKSEAVRGEITEQESRNTQHVTRAKLDEAHRMLSEVYHWFTEGFETKDLQEAKVLLDALSQ